MRLEPVLLAVYLVHTENTFCSILALYCLVYRACEFLFAFAVNAVLNIEFAVNTAAIAVFL